MTSGQIDSSIHLSNSAAHRFVSASGALAISLYGGRSRATIVSNGTASAREVRRAWRPAPVASGPRRCGCGFPRKVPYGKIPVTPLVAAYQRMTHKVTIQPPGISRDVNRKPDSVSQLSGVRSRQIVRVFD